MTSFACSARILHGHLPFKLPHRGFLFDLTTWRLRVATNYPSTRKLRRCQKSWVSISLQSSGSLCTSLCLPYPWQRQTDPPPTTVEKPAHDDELYRCNNQFCTLRANRALKKMIEPGVYQTSHRMRECTSLTHPPHAHAHAKVAQMPAFSTASPRTFSCRTMP